MSVSSLEGRCLHYGGAMPYLPIVQMLKFYFEVKDVGREVLVRKNLRERVLGLDENLKHCLSPFQDLLSLKVEDEAYLALDPQIRSQLLCS